MKQIIYADSYNTMWRVFILSDGQRKDTHYFKSPLKAIRYAYYLKNTTGLVLARKASELLSKACAEAKEQKEQPTADAVTKETPKKKRSSKKSTEVAA